MARSTSPVAEPPPSALTLFSIWFRIGLQSFGGGLATLALIRREFIEVRGWITPDEFTRYWALVTAAPGINLLALTILIGRKTGGTVGVAVALAGLLTPSVPITILLTAAYAHIRDVHWVRSAVRGIVPATVGVGVTIMAQTALPVLRSAMRQSKAAAFTALAILIVSASAIAVWPKAVVFALLAMGFAGALGMRPAKEEPVSDDS